MKISSQDLDTFFTILVQLIHNSFIFIFENMTCKEKKESTAKEPENRNLHNRRGVLEVNIMKNSFVKKLGLTAASAAVFGLVSSGVFISVNGVYDKVSEPAAQEAGAVAGESSTSGTTIGNAMNDNSVTTAEANANAAEEAIQTGNDLGSTEDANDKAKASGTMTVQGVASNSMPAMVAITNTSVEEIQNYFGGYGFFFGGGNNEPQTAESVSMGTGVIIGETDDQVIIASNQHVVTGADTLSVAFIDETAADAQILGEDADTDLAVIAVNKEDLSEDTLEQIKVIEIGSSDKLVVGEQVVAIGNALGYGQSVSTGIVSALNRSLVAYDGSKEGTDNGLIQTDAAINPGNSGGALLNMNGELIGINSAKYADTDVEGMGYAIPITDALPILESLKNGEKPEIAAPAEGSGVKLGVTVATVSEQNSSYYRIPQGAYVKEVEEGSAADEAGIEAGDIITAIDDIKITSVDDLTKALSRYSKGDSAEVTIAREVKSAYGMFDGNTGSYRSGTTTVTFGSGDESGDESVQTTNAANLR